MSLGSRLLAAALTSAVAAVISGCGSSHATRTLPAGAVSQLRADLDRLQSAAAAHDPSGAGDALDAFAAEVARQQAAGHLAPSAYAALRTGIARARGRVGVELPVSPPAQATTATGAPQPLAPTAAPSNGNGNGKKHDGGGKGHGDGGNGGN